MRPRQRLSEFIDRPRSVRRLDDKRSMREGSSPGLDETRWQKDDRFAQVDARMAGQWRTQRGIEWAIVVNVHRVCEFESKNGCFRVVAQFQRNTRRVNWIWSLFTARYQLGSL